MVPAVGRSEGKGWLSKGWPSFNAPKSRWIMSLNTDTVDCGPFSEYSSRNWMASWRMRLTRMHGKIWIGRLIARCVSS